MKLTQYILAILGIGLVTLSATAGIKEKKRIVNGCRIVVIKTGGIIVPGTTSVLYYPTNQPGVLLGVTSASNPGVLGMTAGGAGTAASGVLLRPARTKVNVQSDARQEGFMQGPEVINTVTPPAGGGGGFTPPGHQPGHGNPAQGND